MQEDRIKPKSCIIIIIIIIIIINLTLAVCTLLKIAFD